ncbi:YdbH domain-containing protein [Novosphingobium sp. MMS21-SN21R]|uniref:YdbH domain-containing protein n=1 Tax=Novosphingobium sp. MMS21-SN21R TaxID=2969298 RepID=UPI002884156C|nr:YdbH domain-containing protein [Novosphingobium sp. MMS21-SN21R]MDT0507406.1 YdbH domain-containing protein [Novosphingobium sp. MMS21-SN21R]
MADRFEMAESGAPPVEARGAGRSRWQRIAVPALAIVLVAGGGLWLSRSQLADRIIMGQIKAYGLPATYEIESIGPRTQVLRNLVVGDPKWPDLTVERVLVGIEYRLGTPVIGSVKLVRPRIYGQYLAGKLSFGSLDKVLFAPTKPNEPFAFPKLELTVEDGRGLMLTDFGKVGITLDGSGALQNGFTGTLAGVAPRVAGSGCVGEGASLFGKVSIRDERPSLTGPLRLERLTCESGVQSGAATVELDVLADKGLGGFAGNANLRGKKLVLPGASAESLALDARLGWRENVLSGRVEANAGGVRSGGVSLGLLGVEGLVKARNGFDKAEFRGSLEGQGVRQGPAFDRALGDAQAASADTLLGPMLAQMRAALKREERGSRLAGEIALRRNGAEGMALVIPQAQLVGGSGAALLTLSRFQAITGADKQPPRLAGNFTTGGAGMPRIAGRMERGRAGQALFRLTMAPWRAQGGSLAIPEMMVAQVADGSIGFAGTAQVSGAIPGGSVQNLVLPVNGAYGARGELSLWKRCVSAKFDRLLLGEMAVDGNTLNLCPPGGSAIVRNGTAGLRVAAGTPSLDISGRLGETPLTVRTGAVGFAWPGVLNAKAVEVTLGPPATATRLKLADLDARLGKDFTGRFGGVDANLAAVPLDVTNASGEWRYAGGALVLSSVGFDLTDRLDPARFERLRSDGASLTLADNRITASALLREAKSSREVARAVIRHDLSQGSGHADLDVDGLVFDKAFQPADLTRLALGVVANTVGTVRGKGVIDWNQRGVTSSGRFGTENLDLAAAFGPVKGLSGSLEFTDLLGMVTAPHQKLKVASINPGIEVTDGIVDISLLPDQVLRLHEANWPFLGGTLKLEPTDLRLGLAEARRYTLTVAGIDAAKFLEKMELANISATGAFDGQFPLVFDANGGRIEEGTLVSRAPGGTVSYVGALSYENMGAMANFAFDALKSLDYKTMTIAMRGDLEGEIITNVKFGGVKQGAGTKSNFITKQVANLPIQFNINIRAPFYQLITSMKAMYDPASIKDPRTLGLVDAQGRPVRRLTNGVRPGGTPVIVLPGTPQTIQPAESANLP